MVRRTIIVVAALLFTTGLPVPASAQTPVDLQLVLAVDASGSVSHQRFELQKQGYVAAFKHPRVLQAVLSGLNQSIAVTMVQWTGPALQVVAVKWSLIKDAASIGAFAGAIDTGVALLNDSPYKAARRIIDISGDGPNNRGRSVIQARDEAVAARIGINGLPILALDPTLDTYYEHNVIGGPGAFVVPAKDYETFAEAILKKLITEIAGPKPGKIARR
jgi:hypothetical protein